MQLLRLIKLRGLDRSHSDSLESMRCNRTLTWRFPAVRTGDPPVRPRRPADSEVGSEIRERSEDQQQAGKSFHGVGIGRFDVPAPPSGSPPRSSSACPEIGRCSASRRPSTASRPSSRLPSETPFSCPIGRKMAEKPPGQRKRQPCGSWSGHGFVR